MLLCVVLGPGVGLLRVDIRLKTLRVRKPDEGHLFHMCGVCKLNWLNRLGSELCSTRVLYLWDWNGIRKVGFNSSVS